MNFSNRSLAALKNMSDADAGKISKALIDYSNGEDVEIPEGMLGCIFIALKSIIDGENEENEEQANKRADISRKRSEAGRRGGSKKKSSADPAVMDELLCDEPCEQLVEAESAEGTVFDEAVAESSGNKNSIAKQTEAKNNFAKQTEAKNNFAKQTEAKNNFAKQTEAGIEKEQDSNASSGEMHKNGANSSPSLSYDSLSPSSSVVSNIYNTTPPPINNNNIYTTPPTVNNNTTGGTTGGGEDIPNTVVGDIKIPQPGKNGCNEYGYERLWVDSAGKLMGRFDMLTKNYEELRGFMDDDGIDKVVVEWAINESIEAGQPNWRYLKGILNRCVLNHTLDIQSALKAQEEFQRQKQARAARFTPEPTYSKPHPMDRVPFTD